MDKKQLQILTVVLGIITVVSSVAAGGLGVYIFMDTNQSNTDDTQPQSQSQPQSQDNMQAQTEIIRNIQNESNKLNNIDKSQINQTRINQLQPLGEELKRQLQSEFSDLRVFIHPTTQEIVVTYTTTADGKNELQTEMHQIGEIYSEIVSNKNVEPTSLNIVVGEVLAFYPKPAIISYSNGELEQDAYHETMQILSTTQKNKTPD